MTVPSLCPRVPYRNVLAKEGGETGVRQRGRQDCLSSDGDAWPGGEDGVRAGLRQAGPRRRVKGRKRDREGSWKRGGGRTRLYSRSRVGRADDQKGADTRKGLTPEKALAPEKC
jgi:hypothetical protein